MIIIIVEVGLTPKNHSCIYSITVFFSVGLQKNYVIGVHVTCNIILIKFKGNCLIIADFHCLNFHKNFLSKKC